MTVKPGDFLPLNYNLKVKESGKTVDTTYDTVAKEAHIHRHDSPYGPLFVILGEGWLPKGLEESLVGLDIGKPTTVELSPEKGYGARDPTKVRLVPIRRFRDENVEPIPGTEIQLGGRPAVVRSVGAGRVQVDYNHPLAGRTLVYDVSVEKVLDDQNEKILSLISKRIPEVDKSKFVLDRKGSDLDIDVPEEAFYLSGLQVAKKAVTTDLQKYFPDLDTISFREVFKRTTGPAELTEPGPISETKEQAKPAAAEEKKTTSTETKETSTPTARKRRTPTAKKQGAQKRAMMGSESQR